MSELISFLYSEEQGCFHHDPPESDGDEYFQLLAKNISDAKCLAFTELMSFKTGGEVEYSFDFVKKLWLLFDSTIDMPDSGYNQVAYALVQMKDIYLHNNL